MEKMRELRLKDQNDVRRSLESMEELRKKHPHIVSVQINSDNCFGNHVMNSKNCYWAFDIKGGAEDSYYIFHGEGLKDCCDSEYLAPSELLYECTVGFDLYNCNFCLECGNTKNAEFCIRVFNSHDCFGCVGRNHAEYEILNEKHTKEEYFKKMAEIKDRLRIENKYMNWLPDVIGRID